MKIIWEGDSSDGTSRILAEPGPYDGYPSVGSLILERLPRAVSHDRLAVAAVLAFGKYINGPISFPNAITPATASAISDYLSPASIHVEQIDFEPRSIEHGPNVFTDFCNDEVSDQKSRIIRFFQPNIWDTFGSSFGANELHVPSNMNLLHGGLSVDGPFWDADLAALVLLSEDYGVGTIRIRGRRRTGLGGLLQSCGLSLQIDRA